MKKLTLAAAAVAALVTAGIAVARSVDDNAQNVQAVSGTFTATTVANSQTRSCTTSAGKTIATTRATYTGTASGSPDLTGNVRLDLRSTINTTDQIGVVAGKLKIAATGGNTEAQFSGVYDHGSIAGLATGHGASPHTRLLGNLSAAFNTSTGLTSGHIGSGASGGSAVELSAGGCAPSSSTQTSQAKGTISANASGSITVAGLTCTVPSSLAAKVNPLQIGSKAEIKCSLVNGVNTLVKIDVKQ